MKGTKTYPRHELRVTETLSQWYLPEYPYRVVTWLKVQGTYDRVSTLGYYRTLGEAEQALKRFAHTEEANV